MREFRKKPVEVEAVQWWPKVSTASNLATMRWLASKGYPYLTGNALEPATLVPLGSRGIYIDPADGALVIRTDKGDMKVSNGDWIIYTIQGPCLCKPDIFAATYEAV